jgi:hypothetical protein
MEKSPNGSDSSKGEEMASIQHVRLMGIIYIAPIPTINYLAADNAVDRGRIPNFPL